MLIFVMLVFTTFYTFFVNKQVAAQQEQEALMAEYIANQASFEVRMALTQGDGYTRNFTLPQQVMGTDYTVDVSNGLLILDWGDRIVVKNVVVDAVNGNIVQGENRIRNRDGELYVD